MNSFRITFVSLRLFTSLWIAITSLVGGGRVDAGSLSPSTMVSQGAKSVSQPSGEDQRIIGEAERFSDQSKTETRAFYRVAAGETPDVKPDGDPPHLEGASGGAYLEILPDTRRTHDDKLIKGTNFSPNPGVMAVLTYHVNIVEPGRYYVWVRAHSTGSEDNGLHVGLDGQWPESGQRLQWCKGKNTWRWESKQRTESVHCGEPYKIFLDIETPGVHSIAFSMREDGFEFDQWLLTKDRDMAHPDGDVATPKKGAVTKPKNESPTLATSDLPLQQPRQADGDGSVTVSGELRQWHKVTLDVSGPYAHEYDNAPNPFTDRRMTVTWKHSEGTSHGIPGYFAADGKAAESSAKSGTVWRSHFAPDRTGEWTYRVSMVEGANAALDSSAQATATTKFDGVTGTINIKPTNKKNRDLRSRGLLEYVGERYLKFAGTGEYFLKFGADAPETLLAYADFDDTIAGNPKKSPLKTWSAHLGDWRPGNPSWKDGRGKGLIGAINYMASKGCNAFSFLTYNAGGDGDNVWPFVSRNDKLHYDCSKLDQWGIVFDHGTGRGMHLHFKMQETENDDHSASKKKKANERVPESLDGGDLGWQRKLYCRELIARFGHNLALNWNIGEECTQTSDQIKSMIDYIAQTDPYDHPIVLHTYPNEKEKQYAPLLGDRSKLTGLSLQNSSLETTHHQTLQWVNRSTQSGKPWVVAFDESGSAAHGQCPDLGYRGYDGHDRTGKMTYTRDKVRAQTLWGTLMAGGAGNEYYFGYKYEENDLLCEDWRSRDRSWDDGRIAIEFFRDYKIPFWEMKCADKLVGNSDHGPGTFCFAKPGSTYVVYLPNADATEIDLSADDGIYQVDWFSPTIGTGKNGIGLHKGSVANVTAGGKVGLGDPPTSGGSTTADDWVVLLRK